MPSTKIIFNIILLFALSFTAFSQKYPEMVKVKTGMFLMGDLKKDFTPDTPKWIRSTTGKTVGVSVDTSFHQNEGKLKKVLVGEFSISKYPISVEQYKAYCYSMGFDMPELPTDTKETDPMINVSFEDTESYCRWLKRKTGKEYSVPTEAEWEFASKGASSSIPKGLETQPEVGYKEIIVDNDLILRSNGLVWGWVQDIYLDKDRVKYSPRNQRVVRKGTTGKKSANNQPYLRKGIFQDSTKVDVGFRVVERPIRKYKLFTNDSLKLR